MITIKPVSSSEEPQAPLKAAGEASPKPAGEAPATADDKKKRMPLIWIPATIGLGLLMAAGYLGTRIFMPPTNAGPKAQSVAAPIAVAKKEAFKPEPAQAPAPKAEQPKAEPVKTQLAKAEVPKHETVQSTPAPVASVQKPAVAKPVPPLATPAVSPVVPQKMEAASGVAPALIAPKSGEKYVQIGAIAPIAVPKYLSELRRNNWEPKVAPGPKPELVRVLVGPYADPSSINKVRAQLQIERIDSFVRIY